MRPTAEVSRRSFLGWAAAAAGAFIGVVVGVPLAGAALTPGLKKQVGGQWIDLGPVASFPKDEPKLIQFGVVKQDAWVQTRLPKSVWVVRRGDDFICFNSRCTHLGCIVNWDSAEKVYRSPCHGGVFSPDGDVTAGPPPRPLDVLPYKVVDGELWVEYTDFRLGVSEKVLA